MRRGSRDKRSPFVYDAAAAAAAVKWIQCLTLRVGDSAGKRIELMPWQRHIVEQLFGWRRRDNGRRRYRRVSCWIPRGNGKTPFAAALALCILLTSGEAGAEIYSVAADREQAQIAFDDGAHMARESKVIAQHTREMRRSLIYARRGSTWKVLSSDARTKHGSRPYVVIFDELHTQKSRDLWAAMETGLGKRQDSLMISISTAGVYNPESLAWQEYEYACKVRDGVIDDPHTLVSIYEAADEDDWNDPATWRKANPGLGITVFEHALSDLARKAEQDPAALADFKQLHLNIWVRAERAAIDARVWDANDQPILVEAHPRAWIGVDVGERDDLTGLAVVVPHADGTYSMHGEAWIARDKVVPLTIAHKVPYRAWVDAGWIRESGGHSVDLSDLERRLLELREVYDVREICIDPWNAYAFGQRMTDAHGFVVVEVRQGTKTLSEPTKDFLNLVAEKRVRHGGNPVMRWMASNLTLRRDANGNVAPHKAHRAAKIDCIAATINALSRARLGTREAEFFVGAV